jgi:hypothetical protein
MASRAALLYSAGMPRFGAQAGRDRAAAEQVAEVEEVVVGLLGGLFGGGSQRAGGLAVDGAGGDAGELELGVAEGGEGSAVDAAGVDADRSVEPLGLGDRGVAVHDDRPAAVLAGPVVADGEAVLVGLAGGLAVEGELADGTGAAALQALLEAGVGDHELAVVEHVVADEGVDEGLGAGAQLGEGLELGEGLGEAVGGLDLVAPEVAQELGLVVAGDAEGEAAGDHVHDEVQDLGDLGAAVDEVAEEDDAAAGGVGDGKVTVVVASDEVAELAEQVDELVEAAVDVADDVEGAVVVAAVGPQADALEGDGGELVGGSQDVDVAEALALEAAQGLAQEAALLADGVGADLAVFAGAGALEAELGADVEDDGDGDGVVLAGEGEDVAAGCRPGRWWRRRR